MPRRVITVHRALQREGASMKALASVPSLAAPRVRVLEVMGNAIVGGMESTVLRLVAHLPRDRFHVTVLAPFASRCTEALRALGVEVILVPMPQDMVWSSVQLATSVIAERRIDVLHAHLGNAHVLAGLAARLTGRQVLATVHARQITPLELEAHRAFGNHLHVVCQHSHLHALGMGAAASHLHAVPNSVDTDLFKPAAPPWRASLRAQFGLDEGVPLVGFVGRLSPEKGPDLFVRCAQRVHDAHPHAHFVLVGDGPMRGAVQARIAQLGLSRHVHLAGVREDMADLYPQLDVLVSSSLTEAMPLAVMEAMACAVPVVATRVGGVPDLVVEDCTGLLAELGDVEGLAALAGALIDEPERRREMGRQARQRMVEHFGMAASVARIAVLLERLAHERFDMHEAAPVAQVQLPVVATSPLGGTTHGRANGQGAGPVAGANGAQPHGNGAARSSRSP